MKGKRPRKASLRIKAVEILIDGSSAGVFIPPAGCCFAISLIKGQNDSLSACVTYPGATESAKWRLTINAGQRIAFKMVESPVIAGSKSQILTVDSPTGGANDN